MSHLATQVKNQSERRKAADKLVKLWNAYTGEITRTLAGHTEGISDIAWSNDKDYIASASDDKTIRVWSIDAVSASLSASLYCLL